jgi:hypothetical protein
VEVKEAKFDSPTANDAALKNQNTLAECSRKRSATTTVDSYSDRPRKNIGVGKLNASDAAHEASEGMEDLELTMNKRSPKPTQGKKRPASKDCDEEHRRVSKKARIENTIAPCTATGKGLKSEPDHKTGQEGILEDKTMIEENNRGADDRSKKIDKEADHSSNADNPFSESAPPPKRKREDSNVNDNDNDNDNENACMSLVSIGTRRQTLGYVLTTIWSWKLDEPVLSWNATIIPSLILLKAN